MDERFELVKMFDLSGKSAIVTGASSGLGISFTEALAEAGADVVICARRDEKLIENANRISKYTNRKIIPVKARNTAAPLSSLGLPTLPIGVLCVI